MKGKQESLVNDACMMSIICFFIGALVFPIIRIVDGERETGGFTYGPSTQEEIEDCIDSAEMGFRNYPGDHYALVTRASLHNLMEEAKPAIDCCNKAIEINPDYMYAYAERALAYGLLHDFDKAEKDINTAFKLDPNNYHTYKMQGRVSVRSGNYEEGISYLSRAIKMNPEDYSVFVDRAKAYELCSKVVF